MLAQSYRFSPYEVADLIFWSYFAVYCSFATVWIAEVVVYIRMKMSTLVSNMFQAMLATFDISGEEF